MAPVIVIVIGATHLHLCLSVDLEVVQRVLGDRRRAFVRKLDKRNVLLRWDGTDLDEAGVAVEWHISGTYWQETERARCERCERCELKIGNAEVDRGSHPRMRLDREGAGTA
jgi:hypothetical protein